MLNLDSYLRIPDHVKCTRVDDDAVLLNTRTNQYFALTEVGARLWELLSEGKTFRATHQTVLTEYNVQPDDLEHDLLDLVHEMMENGLVELVEG